MIIHADEYNELCKAIMSHIDDGWQVSREWRTADGTWWAELKR